MKCSPLTLIFLVMCSTDSLANVVQVRSGEHANFTRVALRIEDPVKYNFKVSQGKIKVKLLGDDIHLDIGSAMNRLSSGRVQLIDFNKESISLNIETISEAHVVPTFESPYLFFDVYDELFNYSLDGGDISSRPLTISRPDQIDLLPTSKRLMKGSFHTGRSWSRGKQIEAKLDLPLSIGLGEISPTSSKVPDFDCYGEAEYQMEGNSGNFIVDLRSTRKRKSLEGTSETLRRWNLIKEENSLTGRKQEITAIHPGRRDAYSGDMLFNSDKCKDGEASGFSPSSSESNEIGVGTPQKGLSQIGSEKLESAEASDKYIIGSFEETESGDPIHDFDAYAESALVHLNTAKSYDVLNREFLSIPSMDDKFVRNFYERILANDDATLIYRYFSISQISRLSPEVLSELKKKIKGDGYLWLSAEIAARYNDLDNGRNE
ncbi:hypothetical protein [Donghicola tyrosinivorans]|uniref:Uncharacterized protein n=1 Tax=Donghicola tyrosinivorans TaxID=1652492 RepID=A0A2T0WXY6_9RHOB|nr:hypothetical protein [Donghicola tyrosinivorans]PRY91566.1 hypothetical protein CLV74_103150 [Donghicola tyrosinivorans]